uniref:Uncharacterized protein n=1 Tax=Cannabis sativa TaxID=3483 RepID=A0A803P4N7_CANSA
MLYTTTMVATRITVEKFGIRDGDTPVDNVNPTTQANKARVDGDPSEVTIRSAKKTQHIEKYVDENPINEDSKDDLGDDDPEDDGKDKEEEYCYEPDPAVTKMAKELIEIKKKLED